MRKLFFSGSFFLFLLLTGYSVNSQTVTELVVPSYFGSKSAPTANNSRMALALCVKIDGLLPNTTYDLKPGLGLVSDPSTSYGAGNYWTGTTFSGTTSILNCFTTDATGSSGPVWFFMQPTGNSSRFDAGQVHNLRLGWITAGGMMPTAPLFVGSKTLTALDIPVTPRTSATTDDGCFIKGSCLAPSFGKYVLLFNNEAGSGDPLFSYMIRPALPTQSSNSELPVSINDIYTQSGSSADGDYPAVIPVGANNPNGVRRVESRNPDNTLYAVNTSTTGIWPSGANTTTAVRRDVVILTNSDTPLAGAAPGVPVVVTNTPITNISFNSATGGGNVTGDGGSTVTARGLCWSTSANPTIAASHTTEPGTLGPFISNMTGLQANTTYHVRAYATNTNGTSYGADVTFSTLCEVMAPLPDFSASKVNLTVGESINFFDSTLFCPEAWNWSFNGGTPSTSTLQNPTGITYNFPGDYTVCLTASNQWGQQTACKTAYIHVIGPTNAPLVMTEINYRSPLGGTDSLEFIELYNNGSAALDLVNFAFTQGVEYTFPAITLNPGGYMLLCKSPAFMTSYFNVPSYQWNAGSALSNGGEAVVVKDYYGYTVDSVYYLPYLPWDTMAYGKGPSLELCDPSSDNTLPQNWRHAVEFKATTPAGDSVWASPLEGCSYLPVAGFTASDTTILAGQTVTFSDVSQGQITSWQWQFEGGTPSSWNGQQPPAITYLTNGSYPVALTVGNNAGYHTLTKAGYIKVGPVGLYENTSSGCTLSPNPVHGDGFTVSFDEGSQRTLLLYDCTGRVCSSIQTTDKEVWIPVTGLQEGLYFLRVTREVTRDSHIQKLIIQQNH